MTTRTTRRAAATSAATWVRADMSDALRCLYYAFGGGLGHVMRTLALARQVARLVGGRHLLLANSPFAETFAPAITREPGVESRFLSPSGGAADAVRFVCDAIRDIRPDVFVVDTFAAGL